MCRSAKKIILLFLIKIILEYRSAKKIIFIIFNKNNFGMSFRKDSAPSRVCVLYFENTRTTAIGFQNIIHTPSPLRQILLF